MVNKKCEVVGVSYLLVSKTVLYFGHIKPKDRQVLLSTNEENGAHPVIAFPVKYNL